MLRLFLVEPFEKVDRFDELSVFFDLLESVFLRVSGGWATLIICPKYRISKRITSLLSALRVNGLNTHQKAVKYLTRVSALRFPPEALLLSESSFHEAF